MTKYNTCIICQKGYKGHGNNPSPIKNDGRCCDKCNIKVIQERITQMEKRLYERKK